FKGRFHDLTQVSIVPAPIQRPIPIWLGGTSDAAVKRAARIGDGWMPIMPPDEARPKLALLHEELAAHGRHAGKLGLEAWRRMPGGDPQRWAAAADGWRALGADLVMLYPMYRIPDFADQIALLRRFKEVAG